MQILAKNLMTEIGKGKPKQPKMIRAYVCLAIGNTSHRCLWFVLYKFNIYIQFIVFIGNQPFKPLLKATIKYTKSMKKDIDVLFHPAFCWPQFTLDVHTF